MSNRLPNPLDNFQSYSTHFIMLACRTTELARNFADDADKSVLDAINATPQLGAGVSYKGSESDVFLVLDTRRFSQFTVQKMKYEVLINGLQSGTAPANMATMIEMTILDSVGISFINYLQWLMDSKMQCGFDGMIFMLRVLFVGHNVDGSSETVQTTSIPMHLNKMDVNLDYAKGIYECLFMPNFNFAVNQNQRWLNIGQSTSYHTTNENTLGAMIDSFEKRLNEDSKRFYDSISAKFIEAGRQPAATRPGQYGRLVKYMITIPDEWLKYEFTGASVNAAIEKVFEKKEKDKQTSQQQAASQADKSITPAKSTSVSVDPGKTITEVLEAMLGQVVKVKEWANADKLTEQDQYIRFYKYLVTISSDQESFTVHVDVIPFSVPNVVPPKSQDQKAKSALVSQNDSRFYTINETDGTAIPKNSFELDYIFSGKNLDIINFDLKLQDLQFLLASNVRVSEGDIFNASEIGQGVPADKGSKLPAIKSEIFSARQYDPILMPLLSPEQVAAFSQYVTPRKDADQKQIITNSQSYTKNLSAFYAQSPIMINMTIKGNPDIMMKFNFNSPVPTPSSLPFPKNGPQTSKAAHRKNLIENILKIPTEQPDKGAITNSTTKGAFSVVAPLGSESYASTPVFAKINIFGPNVDPASNQLIDGENFAKEVLYNNYYVVFKVVNIIESGVFTQELEMWSHNVYGQGKLSNEVVNAAKR